jgi:FkbM family methyltransferase
MQDINLKTLDGYFLNLNNCDLFLNYYNNPNSYAKHIIDLEINNGHYDDEAFKKIFKNKNAVVIDGGANIGLFSLMLYRLSKIIYAVEPTNDHINVLKEICKKHNIDNIKFSKFAFNNYTGKCNFSFDSNNSTTNKISDNGDIVNCIRIFDFIHNCGESKIDLLKLDIEGGEYNVVLNDATFNKIASCVENIYIEAHPPAVDVKDIILKFIEMGYTVKSMNSQYLNNNLNILASKK